MKLFLFPLKRLHIHIYMTNNGNMEKSRSHGLIYLTFPILTSIYYGSIESLEAIHNQVAIKLLESCLLT